MKYRTVKDTINGEDHFYVESKGFFFWKPMGRYYGDNFCVEYHKTEQAALNAIASYMHQKRDKPTPTGNFFWDRG